MFSPKFSKLWLFTFREKKSKRDFWRQGVVTVLKHTGLVTAKGKITPMFIVNKMSACRKGRAEQKTSPGIQCTCPSGCDFAGKWHQGAQKGSAITPAKDCA